MQERVKHGERAAARMLLAIERASEHPRYESLEAFTDARLEPAERERVGSHVSHCPRCAAELAQMREYAPQLAKKPKSRRASSRSHSGAIGGWLSASAVLRAGIAVFVGALAVALVWRTTMSTGDSANDLVPALSVASPTQSRSLPPSPGEFDRSMLDLIAQISPPALAAYSAADYAGLANLLAPMAERGHPGAQAVLGLLYAEGLGVRADARIAERLWSQAEGHVAAAKHNLQALRLRQSASGQTR